MKGRRRYVSLNVDNRSRPTYRDSPTEVPADEGDLAIYGRQRNIGGWGPFNGTDIGGDPVRWPSDYRQIVRQIATCLEENNPAMEFQVRQSNDTIFDSYPPATADSPLRRQHLCDVVVPTPYWGAFDRPRTDPRNGTLDRFVEKKKQNRFLDEHIIVTRPKAYPMDFTAQYFGRLVNTPPLNGRRTPSAKAHAISESLCVWNQNVSVLKSTVKGDVFYGVLEVDNPDIHDSRKVLVTGALSDMPDGGISVYLSSTDGGSSHFDVPESYLALLDEPRTEEDERYRGMLYERRKGRRRPWSERRFKVGGKEMDADGMVRDVARSTKRKPSEVESDPRIRGMGMYDETYYNGQHIVRSYGRRHR